MTASKDFSSQFDTILEKRAPTRIIQKAKKETEQGVADELKNLDKTSSEQKESVKESFEKRLSNKLKSI